MASFFSEALDFALTKAGKASYFKLKTQQKLIVEAVVDFFYIICNCFSYVGLLYNLELLRFVQFASALQQGSPLSRAFRNY